jgi:hypothetical protein
MTNTYQYPYFQPLLSANMPIKNKRDTSPVAQGHPAKKTKLKQSTETATLVENETTAKHDDKVERRPQTAYVYTILFPSNLY